MRCADCGKENRAGVSFCEECGHLLSAGASSTIAVAEPVVSPQQVVAGTASAVRCSSCGGTNRTGVTFCESCGERLDAVPTPPGGSPLPPPPVRLKSPALAWGLSAAGLAAIAVVAVMWFADGDDGPATATTGTQVAATFPGSTTAPTTASTAAPSTSLTVPLDADTSGPQGVDTGVVTPMAEVHTTTTVAAGIGGGPGSFFDDNPGEWNHCRAGELYDQGLGGPGLVDRFGAGGYSGLFYAELCPYQRWYFPGFAGETVRITLNPSGESPSLRLVTAWWGEEGPEESDQALLMDDGTGASSGIRTLRLILPADGWYVAVVGPLYSTGTTYGLRIERSGAPFTPDSDHDGFSDQFEGDLAEFFKPLYQFDDSEAGTCVDPAQQALLFQVSPFSGPPDYSFGAGFVESGWLPGERRYAAVTYALALERDCGAFAEESWAAGFLDPLPDFFSHSHPGDLEVLRLIVEERADGWVPLGVIFSRHGNDPEWAYWEWLEIDTQIWGVHPVVWVSWSKHATYPSYAECEDYYPETVAGGLLYLTQFEYCGGGAYMNFSIWSADGWTHNVGERYARTFDYLRDSGSPYLRDITGDHDWGDPIVDLGGERAWGGSYFCGGIYPPWSPSGEECKDGLDTKWWPWTGRTYQIVWEMVVEGGVVEVG